MLKVLPGGTPLRRIIELSGLCSGATVYVKDESGNPFRTFKDRRCIALIDGVASDQRHLVFVHITDGNSGYSMGRTVHECTSAHTWKRTVVNLVPNGTSRCVIKELEKYSIVRTVNTAKGIITPNEQIQLAQQAVKEELGAVIPEDAVITVEQHRQVDGYRRIIAEINESGIIPTHIFVPVGEGELAVELAEEAKNLWGEKAPKIIGVTTKENVMAHKGLDFLKKIGKTAADKLKNHYSKFKELFMALVESGRTELVVIGERNIAPMYKRLNRIGISAEPSAAVAFVGAREYKLTPQDIVVIVNTGKGIYDEKAIERAWLIRIKKAIRNMAIFVCGVLCTVGVISIKKSYDDEEMARLITMAESYADKNNDKIVDGKEYTDACVLIPDMNREKCDKSYGSYTKKLTKPQLRYYISSEGARVCLRVRGTRTTDALATCLPGLTKTQLQYLHSAQPLDRCRGSIENMAIMGLQKQYENGEFDDTWKAKWKWFVRNWKEGTLGTRIKWWVIGVLRRIGIDYTESSD
jgi:threonine dehydratase